MAECAERYPVPDLRQPRDHRQPDDPSEADSPDRGHPAPHANRSAADAALFAAIKPRAYKNQLLDPTLLKYPAYVDSYERTARRRKTGPVIGGYFAGLGLLLLVALATSNP